MRFTYGGDFIMLKYRPTLKQNARTLRTDMTDAEKMLWSRLRRKQLLDVQFYRQKPVGPYILDFYAPSAKLVVEVDGSQHANAGSTTRDERRDAYLASKGLSVLRFDNLQVLREMDAVVGTIYNAIYVHSAGDLRRGEIPPSPPFSKGGMAFASFGNPIKILLSQSEAALAAALDLDQREARLEAQILLCRALDRPRSWLVSHDRDALAQEQAAAFDALLARRLQGEPIAYILGEREFFSLDFKVSPAVLIPRPETELLVELALERIPPGQPCRVLDLGTGSGAVAISLALRRRQADILAVDRSAAALEVARNNAQSLGAHNLRFAQSDWYGTLEGAKFDLIASNPPYIAAADPHLARGDVRFEPISALVAGDDGLDDIRTIVRHAPTYLNPAGWLLFEHGHDQADACRALLMRAGFSQVATGLDLAKIPRVTYGQRPG